MELPAELVCPLCGYLLEDAVMLPCCAASACNFCARQGLDVSDGRCPVPDCPEPEGQSAEDLIPNRQLRSKAAAFKERNPSAPTRPTTRKIEDVVKNLVEKVSSPPPEQNETHEMMETSGEAKLGGCTVEDNLTSPEVNQVAVAPPAEENESKIDDETSPQPESPRRDDNSPRTSERRSSSKEPAPASPCEAPQEEKAPPSPSGSPNSEVDGNRDKNVDDKGEDDPMSKHSINIPSEYMKEAKDDPLAVFNRLMAAKDKEKGIVDSVAHYGAIRSAASVEHNPYGYPPPGHMYHQPPPLPPPLPYGGRHHHHRDHHHHHPRLRSPGPYDRRPHPRYGRPARECYNCGGLDHLIRDCPKPLKYLRDRRRTRTRSRTPSPFNKRRMTESRSPSPVDRRRSPTPPRARRRSRRRTRSSESSLSLSLSDEDEVAKKRKEKKKDKKRKRGRSKSKKKKRSKRSSSSNASAEVNGDNNEGSRASDDEKRSVTLKAKTKAGDEVLPPKTEVPDKGSDDGDAPLVPDIREDVGNDVIETTDSIVLPQERSAKPKWKAFGDNSEQDDKEENFPPLKVKAAPAKIAIKISTISSVTSLLQSNNISEIPQELKAQHENVEVPAPEMVAENNFPPSPAEKMSLESHSQQDNDKDSARKLNPAEIHKSDEKEHVNWPEKTEEPVKARRSSPPRSYAIVAQDILRSPSPPPRRRRRSSPSPPPAQRRRSPSPTPSRRSSRGSPPTAGARARSREYGWSRTRSPPFPGRKGLRGSGWPADAAASHRRRHSPSLQHPPPPHPPSHRRNLSPPRRVESPVRRRSSRSPASKRRRPKSRSPTPTPPKAAKADAKQVARRGEEGAVAGESSKSNKLRKGKKSAAAKKRRAKGGNSSSSSSSSSSGASTSSSSGESSDSELDMKTKKKASSKKKKKKQKKDGKARKGEKKKSKDKKKLKKKSKKAKKATKDLLDAILANHTKKVASALSEKGDLISISKMLKKKGLNLDSDDDERGGVEKNTRRVVLMTDVTDAPLEKRAMAKRDRHDLPEGEEEVLRKVTVDRRKSPPTTNIDNKLLDIKINITNDVVFGGEAATHSAIEEAPSSSSKKAAASDNETEYQSSMSKPPKAPRRDTTESGEISEGNLEAEMFLLGKKYMNKSGVAKRSAVVAAAHEKKEEEEDDKKVGQLVDPESDGSPNPK